MTGKYLPLDDRLYEYLLSVSLRESPALQALRVESDRLEYARMRTASDQAQFMALLVRLTGARRLLEIGTFTGYGTLALAEALPEDGRIVACDVSEEWTAIGRRYWRQAGVEQLIDLRIAPALDTLDALIDEGQQGSFDFAFIDADKVNIANYYERCLTLVRGGGLVAIDNVLWGGSVIDPDQRDADTAAIRAFNERIRDDVRVDLSLVSIGDGLTLARSKPDVV